MASMARAAQSQRVQRTLDGVVTSTVCADAWVMPTVPRVPLWQNADMQGIVNSGFAATCLFYRLIKRK